jgi:hypothetical protein
MIEVESVQAEVDVALHEYGTLAGTANLTSFSCKAIERGEHLGTEAEGALAWRGQS